MMNGAVITRNDVEEIVAKSNRLLEHGISHLTSTLEKESIERREESKHLNQAMIKLTEALSQTSAFVKVYDEKLLAMEKANGTEYATILRILADFRTMYEDTKTTLDRRVTAHGTQINEIEREQTKNTTRINTAWGLSGVLLTLAVSAFSAIYHQNEQEKQLYDKVIQAIISRNEVMATGLSNIEKTLEKQSK
jgi:CII-binding regulator of phage lambda lysogenization HflD